MLPLAMREAHESATGEGLDDNLRVLHLVPCVRCVWIPDQRDFGRGRDELMQQLDALLRQTVGVKRNSGYVTAGMRKAAYEVKDMAGVGACSREDDWSGRCSRPPSSLHGAAPGKCSMTLCRHETSDQKLSQ